MKYTALFLSAVMAISCSCARKSNIITIPVTGGESSQTVTIPSKVIGGKPQGIVAKASVFKMSGDYADHVAVTLGNNGVLTYFPAPSDLSMNSMPVKIGDGWYLNRQGLGPNSVFTKWTFEEYMNLPTVPSPSEIKDAIIPGACVTAFEVLPVTASEALQMNPATLLEYVKK